MWQFQDWPNFLTVYVLSFFSPGLEHSQNQWNFGLVSQEVFSGSGLFSSPAKSALVACWTHDACCDVCLSCFCSFLCILFECWDTAGTCCFWNSGKKIHWLYSLSLFQESFKKECYKIWTTYITKKEYYKNMHWFKFFLHSNKTLILFSMNLLNSSSLSLFNGVYKTISSPGKAFIIETFLKEI